MYGHRKFEGDSVPSKEAGIVGYNDAAFANLKDSGSQGGLLSFLQEAMEIKPNSSAV